MAENKTEPTPVEKAVEELKVALIVSLAKLTPRIGQLLETLCETTIITAKANAEVAVIRVGVAKVEAETALLKAQTERRRAEVVDPVETEALVAEAEAKKNKAKLHVKQTEHELLNFGTKKVPEQKAA